MRNYVFFNYTIAMDDGQYEPIPKDFSKMLFMEGDNFVRSFYPNAVNMFDFANGIIDFHQNNVREGTSIA